MATEALYVPEEKLKYVIEVIRKGLETVMVPVEVKKALLEWCQGEEEYVRRTMTEEFWPKSQGRKK